MASNGASGEDTFLSQIERIRADLREKVARAHQVLQEREAALLSELQQLEDSYRGEGVAEQILELSRMKEHAITTLQNNDNKDVLEQKDARMRELEANIETARDSIRQVELDWDGNLLGIPIGTGSIRVTRVWDNKEKENAVLLDYKCIRTREQACEAAKSTDYGCHSSTQNYDIPTSEKDQVYTGVPSQTALPSHSKPKKLKHHPPDFTRKTSTNSPDTTKTNLLPHTESQQTTNNVVEGGPTRGLKNLGNTCYMNCILQCLSHTLPLRQFYVSGDYTQFLNENRINLSDAFRCVMVELWKSPSCSPVTPYNLKGEIKSKTDRFPPSTQHDAHEFMRFLLNELHEEINRASVEGRKSPADNETLGEAYARYLTWEDSRISELFSGMLRSEVCCSICSNQSIVYIPFMDIALPIPENKKRPYRQCSSSSYPTVHLADCFRMFTGEETLIGEESPYCNKCKDITKSTKQLSIAELPKFLVIQLKKFSNYPKRTKSTHVEFDETWSLNDSANETHTYSLYGIVCHLGSISGGHYVAYCNYNGIWRRFDDKIIKSVPWKHVKEPEAYILFYQR